MGLDPRVHSVDITLPTCIFTCTLGALVTIPADRNQPHAAWEAYALRAGTGLRPYPPTASCPASTGHLLAVPPVHGATGGYTARRA